MSLSEVVQTALDKISYIAKTETVVGNPIQAGEVTLIPVSKVSIGFAAGGGGNEAKVGTGTGAGGGVNVDPIAFVTVTAGKVQVLPIAKDGTDLGSVLSALAPGVVKKVTEYMLSRGDKKSGKERPTKEKREE